LRVHASKKRYAMTVINLRELLRNFVPTFAGP